MLSGWSSLQRNEATPRRVRVHLKLLVAKLVGVTCPNMTFAQVVSVGSVSLVLLRKWSQWSWPAVVT